MFHDQFEPRLAAWIRKELKLRGLTYSDVARITQIDRRVIKRRLDVGLPERGAYRHWPGTFIFPLLFLLGLSSTDLVHFSGCQHMLKPLEEKDKKKVSKFRWKAYLKVCRRCRNMGLLFIGPHTYTAYSVMEAGHILSYVRSQTWITRKVALKIARSLPKSGLPFYTSKRHLRSTIHQALIDQLSPNELLRIAKLLPPIICQSSK